MIEKRGAPGHARNAGKGYAPRWPGGFLAAEAFEGSTGPRGCTQPSTALREREARSRGRASGWFVRQMEVVGAVVDAEEKQ